MKQITYILALITLTTTSGAQTTPSISKELQELPVFFRKNSGQWDNEVLYRAYSSHSTLLFQNDGISYNIDRELPDGENQSDERETLVWKLRFKNSQTKSVVAEGKVDSKTNYLLTSGISGNAINVPDFRKLKYNGIYEGIDLQYYALENDRVKYDFLLGENAMITDIALEVLGAENISINRRGDLEIKTKWGTIVEEKPYSYQLINGVQKEVDIRYDLKGDNTFGFRVYEEYDHDQPLVIDPVEMEWFTYTAGTGVGYPWDIKVDKEGYSYIVGWASDKFITTPGVYQGVSGKFSDMFVQKIDPTGKKLIFSTFIGGASNDWATGIALNDQGEIYVTGWTESGNFPTTAGAYQRTFKGSSTQGSRTGGDVVVLKLNKDATRLMFSTLVGGTSSEEPGRSGIAINANGEIFVNGYTRSTDFPTTSGVKYSSYQGGTSDGFLFKMKADGSDLIYSTYYGGSGDDNNATVDWTGFPYPKPYLGDFMFHYYRAGGIEVNDNDEVFVGGWTNSPNFQTSTGAVKTVLSDTKYHDAFVFKMNSLGSDFVWSTLLGGPNGADAIIDLEIDENEKVYVAGLTKSSSFQLTPNANDRTNQLLVNGDDNSDGFVAIIANNGKTLQYSSYVGGADIDLVTDIEINKDHEMYLVGSTSPQPSCTDLSCRNFPTTSCAFSNTVTGSAIASNHETFMMKLATTGEILYSTLLGGGLQDYNPKMDLSERVSCADEISYSWSTHSLSVFENGDLPITSEALQKTSLGGGDNPVIARFKPRIDIDFSFTAEPTNCEQTVNFVSTYQGSCLWVNGGWTPNSYHWDFGDGKTSSEKNPNHSYDQPGTYEVILIMGCPFDTATHEVTVAGSRLAIELGPDRVICEGENTTLSVDAPSGSAITWFTNENGNNIVVNQGGKYGVTVEYNGCVSSDEVNVVVSNIEATTSVTNTTCGKSDGAATVIPSGNSPFTYQWDDNNKQQQATATNLPRGIYNVLITDNNGCVTQKEVEIKSMNSFNTKVSVIINDGCDRFGGTLGSATVVPQGGTGPYTYRWNDPGLQTTATATGLAAGKYVVEVIDAVGCGKIDSVEIEQKIQISTHVDQEPCGGCSNGEVTAIVNGAGKAPFTYRWNDPNEQTTSTASGLEPGSYVIIVTDAEGCFNSDTVTIGFTSVLNRGKDKFQINPNPNTGVFNLVMNNLKGNSHHLMIFDARGKLMLEQSVGEEGVIDISHLSSGIYMLVVKSGAEKQMMKLIKQ